MTQIPLNSEPKVSWVISSPGKSATVSEDSELFFPRRLLKKHAAFTLIEVLVAFAIMAVLLSAIIQSESDSIYVLSTTDYRIRVRGLIENKLYEIERNPQKYTEGVQEGVFEENHPFAGDRWVITVSLTTVFQQNLKKISYEVFWKERETEKSLSAYVFAKPRRPESNPRLDQVFLHTHNFSLYHNELEPYQDPEVHEVGYFLGKTRYNHVYRLYRREDYYIDSKFDLPDENPYQNDEVLDTNKSITHFLTDDILYFEVQYLEDPVAADDEAAQQEGNTAVEGAENQTKKGWADTWKSAERSALRLPYAVRITVKFPLVTPEELNEMTEVPWDDPAVVASETFEVPIRWKPEAGIYWGF
ncbi:hypothetical protein CHS0354_018452 [Potamilus streckersoni]|uniref:Type II secretion system protein n=1 Tax=Potamilus streckersoni TaxID=2493646 RepID=A0AAE0TBA3_9BIVA|nr:hypothetical protein CHS0354_018452 [Potamilus streckersoni]